MAAGDKAAVASGGAQPPDSVSEMKMLGKYQIEKRIGAGGMGTVYLARDTQLKRVVALKVLSRDKAQNPTLVKRFQAEAQAAAQLRHDNIVAVYDSGEADGFLYIAMEYVEGQDLFEMVQRRGPTPANRSIEIIKQVAAALQHAYEKNIVHRDIKPSNLLIRRDGVVKLTDLGLARSVDDTLETNITRAGTTVGTVDFMSPEQARNSKLADIRSDLYSLGCTWYQMLTGEAPYPEGSVTNKLQAHATQPIPDPRDKNPNVPEGLTAVLQRMMAKKPDDRYQTPADLLDDLKHATLTRAAISREIFGDLSDHDQPTVGRSRGVASEDESPDADDDTYDDDDEEEADDHYDENDSPVAQGQATPNEVAKPPAESRRQFKKVPREAADSRDRADERTENRPTNRRESDTKDNSKPLSEDPTRRAKPKSARHADDTVDNDSSRSIPKVREVKSDPRPVDAPSSKTKSHKPLPPKREPVKEVVEIEKKGLSPEALRNLAVVCGVVVLIVGLGYLIQSFSGSVGFDDNPFAASGNPMIGQPSAAPHARAVVMPPEVIAAEQKAKGNTPNVTPAVAAKVAAPVAEFDVEVMPAWASRDAEPTDLPVRTVGPGVATATHFATIDEALRGLTSTGAIVKLVGAGPFPLPFVELTGIKRLVLMSASSSDRTVIALRPAESQTTAGIKLTDGTLEVRGVHFALDRSQLTTEVKVLEVIDGQLFVQQSSFTATGPDSVAVTAMVFGSQQDSSSEPRMAPSLLVDRVMVRGDGLKGLSVSRANADVVVRDSLLATGSASAIVLTGQLVASVADVVTHKPRRIVRIVRSTLYGSRGLFEVSSSADGGKPPRTDVVMLDSLCGSQGVAASSALVVAARWPQVRANNESWLTRLKWVSKNSLYLGFEQLVDLGSDFQVADAATWNRVWNAKHETRQFQKLAFPNEAPAELSVVSPQEFETSALSYRDIKSGTGGMPGCPVEKLSVPDAGSQQRGAATAMRPRVPAAILKPAEPTEFRKVDLKKQDLGLVLNSNDWPSGTLFEATGSGLCLMTPAKLDGKSVRIIFQQADGTPLKLQAKLTDAKSPDAAAIFSITRGALELTNGVLEGPATAKTSSPPWLIQATESTLVLKGCRLQGSETDGPHQQGLILWTTAPPASPVADPPVLFCRDSYLTGFGCGIRMEAGQGHVILRNSIVAIRGDGLDLRPTRAGNALLPMVDVEHVTFSAGAAAFRVRSAVGSDEPISVPLRLFVERCAVVPPLVFKAGEANEATLLKLSGPVLEQKQIEWWGASNGVSRQVIHYLLNEGDPTEVSDKTGIAAWRQIWGKTNEVRLLSGDKGVYLAGELPNKWKDLRPTMFELHKNSQSATWAEGKAIGANVRSVDEVSIAKKGQSASPTAPKTVTPGTTVPANKKNVGF